jgi:hypothetical protein
MVYDNPTYTTSEKLLSDAMSAIVRTDDRWTRFAALAPRVVGITPSEADVEQIIYSGMQSTPTEQRSVKMFSETEASFVKVKSAPARQ